MNEKKLAAIAAAYGDAWEKVKEYVDEQGGLYTSKFTPESCGFNGETDFYKWNYWKPRSLRYLNSNNGWIRCDERLPEKYIQVHYCVNGTYCGVMPSSQMLRYIELGDSYSHWQPVVLPNPPIY